MKKKLSKILGVGLSLVLVLSLAFAMMPATPAQAAEGNMTWTAQSLPGSTNKVLVDGSNVTDIAVYPGNGDIIYAINSGHLMNAAPAGTGVTDYALYKSTNGGQGWTGIALNGANIDGETADPLGCVAVAPDDPDVVAISNYDVGVADRVWVTKNAGVSWTQLPIFTVNAGGGAAIGDMDIMDLAISPARSTCLYGREYLVAIADDDDDDVASADVRIIGTGADWATIGGVLTGVLLDMGLYDYMACAFSPYYTGDRSVAVIGADNTTGGGTGAHLQIIDTRTATVTSNVQLNSPTATELADWDAEAATKATNIFAADIALPDDWDPTSASGRVTWCSTASTDVIGGATSGTNDSVYRVNNATCWDLSVGVAGTAWKSIDYYGTIAEGTLFAGAYAVTAGAISTNVSYATDPQVAQPMWKGSFNPPTGDGGVAVVKVDPNFGETGRVFVGTGSTRTPAANNETAFSVSYDAGVSYCQESLIDTGVAANTVVDIDDIKLTPDGSILFMATNEGVADYSLWKSAAAPGGTGSTSFSRVYCFADATAALAGTNSLVVVNPGYADTPALIFANTRAGQRMYVSSDGGSVYSGRFGPDITAAVAAVAMQDADVVYIGQGSNVYKSADSCRSFGAPNALALGTNVFAMDASAEGLVLVGCQAVVYYSTDEGSSFIPAWLGLTGANSYYVAPDSAYADNGYIYCGDDTSGAMFRLEVGGASSVWDGLLNPTAVAIVGMSMSDGVLYGMSAADCDRSLIPHAQPGGITWDTMDAGPPVATARLFAADGNHLYCADAVGLTLYAYDDYLARAGITVAGPAKVSIDPVTGRAELVTLTWNIDDASNSGTGMVNDYDIWICEAGLGFAASQTTDYSPTGAATAIAGLDVNNPKLSVELTTGQWAIALNGGTSYQWMVRARDEVSADAVRSGWSAVGAFSVEASTGILEPEYGGPILQAPTPGAMGVSLYPGFSWAPVSNAVKYEFELSASPATTARGYFIDALVGLTGDNALVTAGWQCDVALEYDTSYFYHVKAITATGGETIWGTAQFTTISEAAVPTPPLPPVELPAPVTPAWIWAIVAIGAVLVIVVIVLIVVTRKP